MKSNEYVVKTPHDGDWLYSFGEVKKDLLNGRLEQEWKAKRKGDWKWTTLGALFPEVDKLTKNSFYIADGDEVKGPFKIDQLRGMWASGAITIKCTYRTEDTDEWTSLSSLEPMLARKESNFAMESLIKEQKKSTANTTIIRIILGLLLLAFLMGGGFRNCAHF